MKKLIFALISSLFLGGCTDISIEITKKIVVANDTTYIIEPSHFKEVVLAEELLTGLYVLLGGQ